jgi:hypothetical protein
MGKEECHLLGFNIVQSIESQPMFRKNIASIFRVEKQAEQETSVKAGVKQVIGSFETSVDFQRITQRYIPEDSTIHNHRYENFRSYNMGNIK